LPQKAAGGGRGGELGGGGLGERREQALGARAQAAGAVQLGQNEADLLREGRLAVGGGVGGGLHLKPNGMDYSNSLHELDTSRPERKAKSQFAHRKSLSTA
jgi:hypothetical protein